MWKRHKESERHDIHEIGSGTNLLFTFLSLKVFRYEEREAHKHTQSFYADCFYIVSSQPNQRAAPVAHKVVWPRPSLNLDSLSFGGRTSTHCFSSNPQKSSAHASGAWCHSHPLVSFPIWGFILTSVNDGSSPRAREHLRSCLHLPNPCTKRKVLSLTKPKSKIYKTKSLCNYITPTGRGKMRWGIPTPGKHKKH